MTVEENIRTVRAIFEIGDRDKNFDAAVEQYASAAYTLHVPGMPDMDRDGMKQFAGSFYGAIPDLKHEVVEAFGDGDRVAVRLRMHGKHGGPLITPGGTIPP